MDQKTTGTVIRASRQWWLKINTKSFRMHSTDGAIFPYIIQVSYTVQGREYTRRKWIRAGRPVPAVGSSVTVLYSEEDPAKASIL